MSRRIVLIGLLLLAPVAIFVLSQYFPGGQKDVGEASTPVESTINPEPIPAIAQSPLNQDHKALPASSGTTGTLIGHLTDYSSSYEPSRVTLRVEFAGETVEANTPISREGNFIFEQLPTGLASLYLEISVASELAIGSGAAVQLPPVHRQLGQVELVAGLNESTFQLVDLHKSNSLTVTVLVNGQPEPGVMVLARSMDEQEFLFKEVIGIDSGSDSQLELESVVTTITDLQGKAEFDALFFGRWSFLASTRDRAWTWAFPDIVTLTADDDQKLLFDIEAFPGSLAITDSVTQQPLANVEIHFYNNFSENGFRLRTDDDGVIRAELPMATYYIEPYPRTHDKPARIDWFDPKQNNHLVALYQRP